MSWGCLTFFVLVSAVFVGIAWSRTGIVTPRYGLREAVNAAKREADDVSTRPMFAAVASRAAELAVALEQTTRLGGVDLIGTYTESEAGRALYAGYLGRLASLDRNARLRLKVESVRTAGDRYPERADVTVAYLVSGGEAQDAGRLLGKEHWYWAMVRGRCDTCGAPQTGPSERCLYCGADLSGPARWVVSRIETFEAAKATA